jgi:hypothetical protein
MRSSFTLYVSGGTFSACSSRMPSSASVCADPRCARITTRPASLRATCTATAPEAVRTFRTYATPEPTRLVPQNTYPTRINYRSNDYRLRESARVSKLILGASSHPSRGSYGFEVSPHKHKGHELFRVRDLLHCSS